MSLGLRRLSRSAETNALAPVSAQEDKNGALRERCHLARSACGCPKRTGRLIAVWLNLTSCIEPWHRGMVGGVVPWSSKVEFEAKGAARRSAFSFAGWTKMSFPVRNGGSEGWLKLPLRAPRTDEFQTGQFPGFSPILVICSDPSLAICRLKNLEARLRCTASVILPF